MDVELDRIDHKVGQLKELAALLHVVLLLDAEEAVAALAALVGEAEDHVGAVAQPAILAFKIHRKSNLRVVSPRLQLHRERRYIANNHQLIIKVAQGRREEVDREDHRHSRGNEPFTERVFHFLDRELLRGRRHILDPLRYSADVCDLHGHLVDPVYGVVSEG